MKLRFTKSAKESNSCPKALAVLLHLATFPSKRSNIIPNGINNMLIHRKFWSFVTIYCILKKIEEEQSEKHEDE